MTSPDQDQLDASCVLVGIPALNEEKHIEACIRSLLVGDARLRDISIVVADGHSSDDTVKILERLKSDVPNLKVIDNPEKLQAVAMNRIVAEATEPHHKIMVRCDAHSVYPPNYVIDVATELLKRDVAGLATTMDATGDNCFQRASAWIVDTKLGSGGSGHRGGTKSGYVPHGHHAGLDLDWFRKIGGYAPDFRRNEDAEYDYRLTQAGGKIWLASEIRLDYAMRPNPRGLWRQYWDYGRGRAQTILKHKMKPQLRQLAPVLNVLLIVGSLLILPLTALGWVWPMIYLTILCAASIYITITKRSACGLWSGPALAIMHVSWGLGFLSKALGRTR